MIDQEIPEDKYFRVSNGPALPSVLALRSYLRMIPQQQYDAHVTPERNDFASWIEHVFGEKDLAAKLRQCRSREQMVWALDDAFAEIRMDSVVNERPLERKQPAKIQNAPEYADPLPLEEDANFEPHKKDLVERNEQISSKYEEVAKRMQEALIDKMPQELEKRAEELKNRYQEIMVAISETRRAGKDALIPALVIRQFMPKLQLARATRNPKDFDIAALVLDQALFELKEARESKDVDVRKEIQALVEQGEKPQA